VVAGGAEREETALKKAAEDTVKNRQDHAVVHVVDAKGAPVADAAVSVEQTQHDFLFGCNIYMFDRFQKPEDNEAYKTQFRDLFNYATTGFYWKSYEPEQGKPNYAATDKVIAWCSEHGIRLKGHPLLWGHEAGVPKWSKGQPSADLQKQRVADILKRYGGKIEFWEVVNEPSHIRNIKIDEPYRWAREADPKGCLIVNDYHVMADGFPPFFKLLEDAKAANVPFDGIGIQAHEPRTMRFPLETVQTTLDHYAGLGKELHITEFTPCSGGDPITGSHLTGKWDEAAQADYAVKFYRVCFAHPAMRAITWWDLCDKGAWLKGGGMLREDLTPKPVYAALCKLIHEEWQTRAEGKTDGKGSFGFQGFHGMYRLNVKSPAGNVTATAHLEKGGKNDFKVVLP
jgi:GH35 family endo-1,4-beta-xylanase